MTYAKKIPLWQRYECRSWYIFLLAELAVSVIVTNEQQAMERVHASLCTHTQIHTHRQIYRYAHTRDISILINLTMHMCVATCVVLRLWIYLHSTINSIVLNIKTFKKNIKRNMSFSDIKRKIQQKIAICHWLLISLHLLARQILPCRILEQRANNMPYTLLSCLIWILTY